MVWIKQGGCSKCTKEPNRTAQATQGSINHAC